LFVVTVYSIRVKLVLLTFVFLVSCAYPKRTTDYKAEVPSADRALIYIYRTPTQIDSLNPEWPKFYINGEVVGKLGVGDYYVQLVESGDVTVSYKNAFLDSIRGPRAILNRPIF